MTFLFKRDEAPGTSDDGDYRSFRASLVRFFERRRTAAPEDLADETI